MASAGLLHCSSDLQLHQRSGTSGWQDRWYIGDGTNDSTDLGVQLAPALQRLEIATLEVVDLVAVFVTHKVT